MTVDNTQDVIDSRDFVERIEELEAELEETPEASTAELDTLKKVAEECKYVSDWGSGEALIRESYFTDYIKELINECYEMPKEMESGNWPFNHLTMNWEACANEAKVDYIEVDFGGVTYLIRSV